MFKTRLERLEHELAPRGNEFRVIELCTNEETPIDSEDNLIIVTTYKEVPNE